MKYLLLNPWSFWRIAVVIMLICFSMFCSIHKLWYAYNKLSLLDKDFIIIMNIIIFMIIIIYIYNLRYGHLGDHQ